MNISSNQLEALKERARTLDKELGVGISSRTLRASTDEEEDLILRSYRLGQRDGIEFALRTMGETP